MGPGRLLAQITRIIYWFTWQFRNKRGIAGIACMVITRDLYHGQKLAGGPKALFDKGGVNDTPRE